jgi:dienelactone hydrolase
MSSSCCPAGSWPALTVDTERAVCGKVQTLPSNNLTVYYVPPQNSVASTNAIIVIYDVYGFKGGRIKSVCDQIACAGFHVVMPDLYGEEASIADKGGFANPDAQEWLKQFSNDDSSKKLDSVYSYLKDTVGVTSIGALGFCWGAYPAFGESARGKLRAVASCHPSLKIGEMFYDHSVIEQAKAAKCPALLCPAGNDPENLKAGGDVQKTMEENGMTCVVTEFPDMQHGWVPRGDTGDERVARDVKKAIETVCAFFTEKMTSSTL